MLYSEAHVGSVWDLMFEERASPTERDICVSVRGKETEMKINLFPRCPRQFSWSLSRGDKSRGRAHVSASIRAVWVNTWSCLFLKWILLCRGAKRRVLSHILTCSGTTCLCLMNEYWIFIWFVVFCTDWLLDWFTDWLTALWGVPRTPRRLRQTGGHTPSDRETNQETWQPSPQPWVDTTWTWPPWPWSKWIPQSTRTSQQAKEQASVQHGGRGCWWANSWTRPYVLYEEETLLLQV